MDKNLVYLTNIYCTTGETTIDCWGRGSKSVYANGKSYEKKQLRSKIKKKKIQRKSITGREKKRERENEIVSLCLRVDDTSHPHTHTGD